jgi:hypothetical protein
MTIKLQIALDWRLQPVERGKSPAKASTPDIESESFTTSPVCLTILTPVATASSMLPPDSHV